MAAEKAKVGAGAAAHQLFAFSAGPPPRAGRGGGSCDCAFANGIVYNLCFFFSDV